MNKKTYYIPVFIFLAGVAASLFVADSFTGWGGASEFAIGAQTLSRTAFFGFPIPEILYKISAAYLPFIASEFAASAGAAILFGLSLSLIYFAAKTITDIPAAGVASAACVLLYPPCYELLVSFNPVSWTFFLTTAILACFAKALKTQGARTILGCFFLAGIGFFHSGFVFLFGILAATGALFSASSLRKSKFFLYPLFFVVATAFISMVFIFLRPALLVNFSSLLPPWLGQLSPLDNIVSRVLNPGDISTIFYNSTNLLRVLSGVYVLSLIAWVVSRVFFSGKRGDPVRLFMAAPLPALFFVIFSTPENSKAYMLLLITLVGTLGATGAALAFLSDSKNSTGLLYATIACLLLIVPPAVFNFNQLARLSSGRSGELLNFMVKDLRRDALVLIDAQQENYTGLLYLQQVKGLRRDVSVIYPHLFLKRAYRYYIRTEHNSDILAPGEEEYSKLLEQISAIAPDSGAGLASSAIRQRIINGITGMIYDALIIQNSPRTPIYLNRIDNILNSRIYAFMHFVPMNYSFRLQIFEPEIFSTIRFRKLMEHSVMKDPVGREISSVYFMNVGEHFFMQERYFDAAPVLEACATLSPNNMKCRFFLGIIYKQWGKFTLSEQNFTEAITLIKQARKTRRYSSEDLFMLSRIYRELGRFQEARKFEDQVQPGASNQLPPGMSRPK